MNKKKDKLGEFAELVATLEIEEFCGLARLLGVQLIEPSEKDIDVRSFQDVLVDMATEFTKLRRKEKRELLRLLKRVRKETAEMKKNGEVSASAYGAADHPDCPNGDDPECP